MHAPRLSRSSCVFASLAILSACGGSEAGTSATPTGLPEMSRPASFSVARAELGKKLFFDTRLSSNGSMSCQTCHKHEHGWTDGIRFSTKVDGKVNTRNSPSLYNVGYLDLFYWDGRAKTLEDNVKAAWKGHMGGDPDAMAAALAAIPEYATEFEAAFGGAPTGDQIVEALASFVRTLQSGASRFDKFKAGDESAMSDEAKQGYALFTGKASCSVCHVEPLFTDKLFHNAGIGSKAETPDLGRGKPGLDPSLPGAFKTPSLRSVSKTAPYFHDGSVADLRDAVKLMASGGIENANRDPLLEDRKLSDAEIDQLVAFLKSLESTEPFTPPALPKAR